MTKSLTESLRFKKPLRTEREIVRTGRIAMTRIVSRRGISGVPDRVRIFALHLSFQIGDIYANDCGYKIVGCDAITTRTVRNI